MKNKKRKIIAALLSVVSFAFLFPATYLTTETPNTPKGDGVYDPNAPVIVS
ncbi:MAG: hypothetical protein IJY62_04530 [Clostridia bacterium]|nr:hypothetical protein [Clostridia bacterium]